MKQRNDGTREYRVCVLGNFSGRNAGDNAILGTLMHDVAALYPNVRFVVPTFNPSFVRKHYARYNVEAVSLLPWALSLKIFGLPVFRAVLGADLVLATDNILFDMKLFNPLFNYLSTLALVLPLAKRRGIPVVLYNMSLGPIRTNIGKRLFSWVIDSAKVIILRDQQSQTLVESLGIPHARIEIGADCAINAQPAPAERIAEITAKEGLFTNPNGTIGFNVNTYLDAYLRKDGSPSNLDTFKQFIADAIDRIIDQTSLDVLFFVTQVMDMGITQDIISRTHNQNRIKVIGNREYTYEEIAGLLAKVECLVAMRTHALILASAMHTPVLGIISYPKTAGYLRTIDQDAWMIDYADLDADSLVEKMLALYQQRDAVRTALIPSVQREQSKARQGATRLAPFLNAPQNSSETVMPQPTES